MANANCMVARTALIMAISYACFIFWVLEQPSSSLMTKMPALQIFQKAAEQCHLGEWHVVKTYMGLFGGDSPKALNLYSNSSPLVSQLSRNMRGQSWRFKSGQDNQMVTKTTRAGKVAVTGGPKLKESQAYTPEFADAVLLAYLDAKSNLVEDLDDDEEFNFEASLTEPPPWADLRIEEVLAYIKPQVGMPA